MITQRYKLSLETDQVFPVVSVSQYDHNMRTIVFSFEIAYSITSAIIKIGSNTINGTITDNLVSFVVTSDLTENEGRTMSEVVINGGIGSVNFIFEVEKTPLENDADVTMGNRALSIIFGREVRTNAPNDALDIIFGGE